MLQIIAFASCTLEHQRSNAPDTGSAQSSEMRTKIWEWQNEDLLMTGCDPLHIEDNTKFSSF